MNNKNIGRIAALSFFALFALVLMGCPTPISTPTTLQYSHTFSGVNTATRTYSEGGFTMTVMDYGAGPAFTLSSVDGASWSDGTFGAGPVPPDGVSSPGYIRYAYGATWPSFSCSVDGTVGGDLVHIEIVANY